MAKKYLLGLDLGTNSVGWCLTDENSKIVKKGGKSLWGVRLFDEASTAVDRRMSRASRRRTLRRSQRIDYLQSIFFEEIKKVDPTFFLRLNQSALHKEDKDDSISSVKGLFNEPDLNDRSLHNNKDTKTIYHLRNHLMETDEKADIRLLYLALAHIVKYRGNFLYEGREFSIGDLDSLKELLQELDLCLSELDYPQLGLSESKIKSLSEVMAKSRGISHAKELLQEIFGSEEKYVKNIIIPLIAGSDLATKKIFDFDEDIEPKSISSRSASFDESYATLVGQFDGRPELQIILVCKRISDILILNKLLGSEKYLSKAMVKAYEEHASDLRELKKYVKANLPGSYNKIFRDYDPKLNNYVRYIGSTNSNKGKIRCEHCSRDDFYKFLKAELGLNKVKKAEDISNKTLRAAYEKMSDGSYLPRQNSSDNGVFPYQLNLIELETILNKQKAYYPFLEKVDSDGYTPIAKIKSLLTFRIPYYVGPLLAPKEGSERGKNSWIVRSEEKIYPWNFDKVVDKPATAEKFIRRMLNRCSYLRDCYCLPAKSIVYQYYTVYNFLNKIRINGELIDLREKKNVIEEVFLKNKSVTKKRLLDYFKARYGKEVKITSSNDKPIEEISCSLSSEIEFKRILGKDYDLDKCEAIIQDLTVFEDKSILDERLKDVHGISSEAAIKAIKGLSYSGWGRLSRELLTMKTNCFDLDTGEAKEFSLLDIMAGTNLNFMEVINDKRFDFLDKIKEHNDALSPNTEEGSHEEKVAFINDTYASPGMKRAIIQAYDIIDDLKKIVGGPIDEYYIECTRTNKEEKGKRTVSRKDKVSLLYSEAKKVCSAAIKAEIESLEKTMEDIDIGKFRSDRVWLYFLQLGRCAYTGEKIDLQDLFDDNRFDIDHIVPQSKIKDDSISNRVLVTKKANNEKSDRYPLVGLPFITSETRKFWSYLKEMKLMDEKKYSALTRKEDITDEELELFVNRQMVFTNQAVKALADTILQFETTASGNKPRIVYSKAENISDFRRQFDIVKSRDANNFHHAHDAYLNVCVGRLLANYYNYGVNPDFIKKLRENKQSIVPERIWSDNKEGNRKERKEAGGGLVWNYQRSVGEIKKDIYGRFDILVTTRSFIKTNLFKKVGIHKAIEDKGDNLIPLKSGNTPLGKAYTKTSLYGGLSDLSYGFYALIEISSKKTETVLEGMPNLYCKPDDEKSIQTYLDKEYGEGNAKVLISCVRVKALLRKGKSKLILTGVTGNQFLAANQSEPYLDKNSIALIKKVSKYFETLKKEKIYLFKTDKSGVTDDEEAYKRVNDIMPIKPDGTLIVSPARSDRNKEITISISELEDLYRAIEKKLNSPIYEYISGARIIGGVIATEEAKQKFKALDVHKKIFVIGELIKAIGTDRQLSNLVLIGGPSTSGTNLVSKTNVSSFDIVSQSPTGFYEKVIWKGR